jgi:hypothetical protein
MNDIFWLENPKILFHKSHIFEIWPYEKMNYNEKLNGVVLILLIVFIHNYKNKNENMENMKELNQETEIENSKFSSNNPLYNVLLTDYTDNVDKPKLKNIYNENTEEQINNQVKNFILENNKDNKDIGLLFNSQINNLNFEKSMRQFNINPSTTIPNEQDDFLKYCYNDLYSEKPLLIY